MFNQYFEYQSQELCIILVDDINGEITSNKSK